MHYQLLPRLNLKLAMQVSLSNKTTDHNKIEFFKLDTSLELGLALYN